jgi:hypothetical protein
MNGTINTARSARTGAGFNARIAAAAFAALVFFAGAAATVSAQLTNKVTVKIPFSFVAGKTALPAGVYTVERSALNLLILRNTDGEGSAIFSTSLGDADARLARTELLFSRYGEEYFLSQVRPSASDLVYRVPRTAAEERLAKKASGPELVTVVSGTDR